MTPAENVVSITVKGVPVELWAKTQSWFDGLLREFDIIVSSEVEEDAPHHLLNFVDETRRRFERFGSNGNEHLNQALARGDETADVEAAVPPEAAAAALELWDRIERAMAYCARGDLLTLTAPADVLDFIEWYLREVSDQVEGAEPTPWSGT